MSADMFRKPWQSVSSAQGAALVQEVNAEISLDHPLNGMIDGAIARSSSADDVLFRLSDNRVADVHLTWTHKTERLPWPRHTIFASLAQWIEKVMIPVQGEQ